MQLEGWVQGVGYMLEDYMIITYENRKDYKDIDNIGQEDDVVFINMDDPSNPPKGIYVT